MSQSHIFKKLLFLALVAAFSLLAALPVVADPLGLPAPEINCSEVLRPQASLSFEERYAALKTLPFKLSDGRQLFVQAIPAANDNLPYLLVMPGMNRGMLAHEDDVKALVAQGYGVVGFNFSLHPLSVGTLPSGQVPYFAEHKMTLQDLAAETDQLATAFRKMGVKRVVPIDLSFSGSVSPFLTGTDLVISTSPMTAWSEVNPDLAKAYSVLKMAELMNPVFGRMVTRQVLNFGYRQRWNSQVDSMIANFKLPEERREEMVEGYLALSRAAEGSAWDVNNLDPKVKRVFILGFGEAPALFRHQLETVQKLRAANIPIILAIVNEAGHMVPGDQPATFAALVKMSVDHLFGFDTGLVIVDPKENKTSIMVGDEMDQTIQKMINTLTPEKEVMAPGLGATAGKP